MSALLIGLGVVAVLYLLMVLALIAIGNRIGARAWAGFIPDCIVLMRRLLTDPRVPRSRRILIWAAIAYLVSPIDLVPDMIPVAGHLDDLVVVAWVLRAVLRGAGPSLLRAQWPGPEQSLRVIHRLTFGDRSELAFSDEY